MGTRQDQKPSNRNPAPGEYNPNKDVVMHRTQQSFDMGKSNTQPRFRVQERTQRNVSAASYDYLQPFGSDVKFKTIGTRPTKQPLNINPSPTQYSPFYDAVKPKSNNNAMTSKTQRFYKYSYQQQGNPDPTKYQKLGQFGSDAPKFTINRRKNDNYKTSNPSPL